jgi:hypothetical protein
MRGDSWGMIRYFGKLRHPVSTSFTVGSLALRFGVSNLRLKALPRVVYYEKLGIAYNRIKKNANTSMIVLLKELESGTVEHHDVVNKNSVDLASLPLPQAARIGSAKFVIVVRNPYTRVLSAFLDKFRLAKFTDRHGHHSLDKEGFGKFLRWLAEDGLAKDGHWDLQGKLMLLPLSCYDKVIRFEGLQSETISYLKDIGIPVNGHILSQLYPSDQSKKTDANCLAESFYDPDGLAIVRELYSPDFESLGYDKFRAPWQC